jgi:hypothetical protein
MKIQRVVRLSLPFRLLLALFTMKTGPLWTEARRKPIAVSRATHEFHWKTLLAANVTTDHQSVYPRFEIVTGH